MASTPYRNRRAFSETTPNLTNFGTDSGSQQRSFSTSDISPERLEEGSVFDFSPLPTDLPEDSPSDSEMNFEGGDTAPVGDGRGVPGQQMPAEVSDFIIRRQIESENSLGTLTEAESVATRLRTDLHLERGMHDLSDFLDEFLEYELRHRNSSASLEPTTVGDNPSSLVSTQNSTSNPLQGTNTVGASNGSCLFASNPTSVNEAWSNQTPILYSSTELGFDYHSHLNSNHSNMSDSHNDRFQAPSLVRSPFTSALDLSNIETPSCSQSTIAGNSGNISPSSTASYSVSQRSPRAQTSPHSQTFPSSWDKGQRSQCLLPVRSVQRDPPRSKDPSSNGTSLENEGGTQDTQGQKTTENTTGARRKRPVNKDKWNSKSRASGVERSLPNEENNNKDQSQTKEGAQAQEINTATTTSKKDKTTRGGAVQEEDTTSSSTETTTNMLPFNEDITMLNADNISIFDQFEDRHFQGFNDIFQQNMLPQQDYSMGEKQITMAQPMPSPISPPEGDMFAPDATFLELDNYCQTSQPSPGSTEQSEQDMTEAYELVMEEILSSIFRKLPGMPQDPSQWSQEQARAWISLLLEEYGRQKVNLSHFQMNGFTLCQMTQEELEQLAPGNGYLIHSNLYCLAKSIQGDIKPVLSPYQQQQFHQQQQQQQPQQQVPPPPPPAPMGYDPNMMYPYPMASMAPPSPAPTVSERGISPSPLASSSDEEEASMSSPAQSPTGPNTSMTPHHTGSIQLWQFLQELLLQPDSYNYCIRFLDRSQGIFKIEDSVEVARLWGMRKNRPAMNYDKLSRSIRQYYRKGIMKKTEISQRLVYQFVTPF